MTDKRRLLEVCTVVAALAAVSVAVVLDGSPDWVTVGVFGGAVLLGENSNVFVHKGASASPSFMVVMAAVAVLGSTHDSGVVASAALIGSFGGFYLPHLRDRRVGILLFNWAQDLLSSGAAAALFVTLAPASGWPRLIAAIAATSAYAAVNTSLVLPYVSWTHRIRPAAIWAEMRPAYPNYFAFGLLGLLMGLVSAEIGVVAIALLAVPMAIARWTYASFQRTKEAHEATIRLFIRLIEAKDPYTAGHTERVAKYALYIAEELDVPPERHEHLRQSALMHDVGKLAVPSRLLNKPGKLTPEEWEVVKRHNDAGIGILARVDFMRGMAVTASDRHGRFEHGGEGTPPELVLEAHIVAVADAFDAMTSTRSYRRALSQEVAFDELRKNAGTQFNPECAEALIRAIERRAERYGLGHEEAGHTFAVAPPVAGTGSAGLGDLSEEVSG